MTFDIIQGDAAQVLSWLAPESVQCCVTSPPYYGLRVYPCGGDWTGGDPKCSHEIGNHVPDRKDPGKITGGVRPGTDTTTCRKCGAKRVEWTGGDPDCDHLNRPGLQGQTGQRADWSFTCPENFYKDVCARCGAKRVTQQVGLELTPGAYVSRLVAVFREVRRVLRPDGLLWIVIGDSYNGAGRKGHGHVGPKQETVIASRLHLDDCRANAPALKPKDMIGIPWSLAFALRDDGWYLRQAVVLQKRAPMPESVTDRCTSAYEFLFMLSKQENYHYDADAIREPAEQAGRERADVIGGNKYDDTVKHSDGGVFTGSATRNCRNVWEYPSRPANWAYCSACGTFFEGRERGKIKKEKVTGPDGRITQVLTCPCGRTDAWVNHVAPFPVEIPERCIKASTSTRGHCPDCGALWQRDVELGELVPLASRPDAAQCHGDGETTQQQKGKAKACFHRERIYKGWRPGCACGKEAAPDLVLDPFSGSASTGVAALALGRDFIGIDLSADYVAASRARLSRVEKAGD